MGTEATASIMGFEAHGSAWGIGLGTFWGPYGGGGPYWPYDVSYMQCMYAKGNQVPGAPSVPQSRSGPPPPGTPPPPGAGTAPPAPVPPAR